MGCGCDWLLLLGLQLCLQIDYIAGCCKTSREDYFVGCLCLEILVGVR